MGAYYPQGSYSGRVLRTELGASSKGTPQFTVTCQILEAHDQFGSAPVDQSYERTVYLYLTENPKSIEITAKQLKVLGFKSSKVSALKDADFTDVDIPLYCKHEEYEGEMRERWSINTPREHREAKPVDPSELRKLDALFGKALKAQAAPEPQPDNDTNRAMQEAAAANDDDSIPF